MAKNEPIGATKLASAKESVGATVLAGGQVDQEVLRKTEDAVAFEWKPGDVILDLYEVRSVTEGFGEDAQEKKYWLMYPPLSIKFVVIRGIEPQRERRFDIS